MTDTPAGPVAPLIANIERAVLGKTEAVKLALVALLADGHLLIEDAPGVGKTALAKAIAHSIDSDFKRLQFTPDMLPSDILGTSVFVQSRSEFEFHPGPIFSQVLLADEINRTNPRTQSALLEAMSERQVSLDGVTRHLNRPFFVLATQNPFEFEGTYPLPENQLDRFMLRIRIGYPDPAVERRVLEQHRLGEPVDDIKAVVNAEKLVEMQRKVREVRVDDAISDYIMSIVTATRSHNELALGVSTRGAITLYHAVQGLAYVEGRDFVTPDDVKTLAVPALAHRVVIGGILRDGQRDRATAIIQQILRQIPVPR